MSLIFDAYELNKIEEQNSHNFRECSIVNRGSAVILFEMVKKNDVIDSRPKLESTLP